MAIPFDRLEQIVVRKPSKAVMILSIILVVLLLLSAAFIALYIIERSKATDSSSSMGTCTTWSCITTTAAILSNLDETTKPCDDFYQYSCGGFIKKTPLPEGSSKIGGDTEASAFIKNSLKEIFEDEKLMANYSKDQDSAVYKAFTYYKSCINESVIKDAGIKPILDVIEKYGSCNITNKNWTGDSWTLEKILARVAVDLGVPAFIGFDAFLNPFNSSEQQHFVITAGSFDVSPEKDKRGPLQTARNDKAFMLDFDKNYKTLMSTVFKLLGANSTGNDTIDDEVKRIKKVEDDFDKIKKYFKSTPSDFRKFLKFMTISELRNLTSDKFNWTVYLEEVFRDTGKSIGHDETLMVIMPQNIKEIIEFMTSKPKSLLANVIIWKVVQHLIPTLPLEFRAANEKYYQDAFKRKPTSRWKNCITLTDKAFQFATTLLYVNDHVSNASLETANELFKEIKGQFIGGLKEQNWMDDATRSQARLKLDKMKDIIAYPPFIKEPSKLDTFYEKVVVGVSRLLENQLSALRNTAMKKLDSVGKYPDKNKFYTRPLVVNAYYNPLMNEMTILAGILQPPFFKDDMLKAYIYGSLGMIVGHEITHGFDKQGSEYDENGNIRQWWTKKSHENFVKRSRCLVNQYNKVKLFGVQVDGNKTLSENIADNGGIKYAFRAYQQWRDKHGSEKKLPGLPFDNNQLFFVSFAQLWCEKYRKDKIKLLMEIDSHSPNPVRVRVPLHNFAEFSKAFGCKQSNDTCAVW